jgi:hypothetical protein
MLRCCGRELKRVVGGGVNDEWEKFKTSSGQTVPGPRGEAGNTATTNPNAD